MNSKPWYASKTYMLNLVALVLAVATMIADPSLAFDPAVVKIAIIVMSVGNMVLRLLTNTAIEGTRAARRQPPISWPGDQV